NHEGPVLIRRAEFLVPSVFRSQAPSHLQTLRTFFNVLRDSVRFVRVHATILPGALARSQAFSRRLSSANEREADVSFTRSYTGHQTSASAADEWIILRRVRCFAY